MQSSYLNAVKNGKDQMEAFVTRTFSESRRESLYSPVSRSEIKTFGDMTKETKIKVQGQLNCWNISSEVVFRRAFTLANCRQDVTLETVLSHPEGRVPVSMFHDDGTMRKCVKADLAHGLEDSVNSLVDPLSTMQWPLFRQHKQMTLRLLMILERRTFRTWCWNLKKQRL